MAIKYPQIETSRDMGNIKNTVDGGTFVIWFFSLFNIKFALNQNSVKVNNKDSDKKNTVSIASHAVYQHVGDAPEGYRYLPQNPGHSGRSQEIKISPRQGCACELNQDQPRAQSRRAGPWDTKVMGWDVVRMRLRTESRSASRAKSSRPPPGHQGYGRDVSSCGHFIANFAIPHFLQKCISPILHFPISPIWTLLQILLFWLPNSRRYPNRPSTYVYHCSTNLDPPTVGVLSPEDPS